jgi:hypothetical protein
VAAAGVRRRRPNTAAVSAPTAIEAPAIRIAASDPEPIPCPSAAKGAVGRQHVNKLRAILE